MARSMWRGAIQFGLVTIPVKLYLATETEQHQLQPAPRELPEPDPDEDLLPVPRQVIPRSETVRGYEWSKGQYVVVTDEDIDAVPLKTMRAIEIEMFVDAQPRQRRHAVREAGLLPRARCRSAQGLLPAEERARREGKSAICKIVLKDREQLAALNPYTSTMLLTTLHWPDEVRALDELNLPEEEIDVKPAERKMAEQLVAA